ASNELRTNALSSVRYAEFCLPSCHYGYNKANHTGKDLVPFLSRYMPHLQTLRLWRPDDFLFTTNFKTPQIKLITPPDFCSPPIG
ncbi:unnamed protein product, partial [Rotaria sordida]